MAQSKKECPKHAPYHHPKSRNFVSPYYLKHASTKNDETIRRPTEERAVRPAR